MHVHDIKDDGGQEGEQAGEMGHTGLHELLPVLHGAPTRPHQVHVGPDDQQPMKKVQQYDEVRHDAVHRGVVRRARQQHDDPVHAVQPLDLGAAQRELGRKGDEDAMKAEGGQPGEADQLGQPVLVHKTVVAQGLTDGQVSIVGHDGENGEVTACKRKHHKGLQETPVVGDDVRRGQQVQEEFGVEACGAVKPVDAKATQENIHGLMQCFVQDNYENQRAVDGYY